MQAKWAGLLSLLRLLGAPNIQKLERFNTRVWLTEVVNEVNEINDKRVA